MIDHRHRCGYALGTVAGARIMLPELDASGRTGCGAFFKHGPECAKREDAHMCPNCGAGPWYWKWDVNDDDFYGFKRGTTNARQSEALSSPMTEGRNCAERK